MKIKIIQNFLLLIIILVICMSCHGDTKFRINNNSDDHIYFSLGYTYPDKTIPINYPSRIDSRDGITVFSPSKWENVFKNRLHADTLMIYIFDAKTMEKYKWYQIQKNNKYIKRYDLSLEDMEKRNWIIEYP